MTLSSSLRRARKALSSGWREPFPRDKQGRVCAAHSEEVWTLDVHSAVSLCCGPLTWDALELLHQVALPASAAHDQAALRGDLPAFMATAKALGAEKCLTQWLEAPGRKHEHVLRLFDVAILRAEALERDQHPTEATT